MLALLVSVLVTVIVYSLSLIVSLAGMSLRGKNGQNQFFSFVGLLTSASLVISFLVTRIIRVSQGVDLLFFILGIYSVAYLIARESWRLTQNKALIFSLYFTVCSLLVSFVIHRLALFLKLELLTRTLG
jgi:hypothetical protein